MKRKMVRAALLLLAVLSVLAPRLAPAEDELIVSAAASLTNAFGDVGKAFEAANPGMKVVFNFAASGPLMQQIEQGAPVDVFASADQATMNQGAEKNLILPESRKDFASNSLVLIVPKDSKLALKGIQELTGKGVGRIAIGNPESVPVGRYTEESLTNEGLWESLKAKSILGNSVRQVLDYVSRGEVDAGFVFATDAAIAKDKVQVVATAQKHKPITYPIALVAATHSNDKGQRFIDFVLSPEGQKILAQFGFGKP